jgi:hypothetical protein
MHNVTHKFHRMQKHKLGVTRPGAPFMETAPGPPKPGMHYMTHISYRMQKLMSGVTCPGVLFVKSVPVPPEHEQ